MTRDDEIREGLDTLVLSTLEYANSCENGSEEKKRAIEDATKVYNLRKEQAKADCEYDEAYQRRVEEIEKRQADNELRKQQMAQQHKEFIQKLVLDGVTNGVKIAMYGVVGRWAGILESGGVLSTGTGKNLVHGVQKFLDFNKY